MKRTLLLMTLFALVMMLTSLWAVPLTEGFEGTVVPPDGWTMSYADPAPPAGNLMIFTTEQFHSGAKSFRFSSFSSASNDMYDQYLVTPLLNTQAANTNFSFWYKGNAYGVEVFKVGWSSTDNNPASFTWSNEFSVPVNGAWTQYVKADVPVGTHYMAIHYYSDYMWYLYVDDVLGPDIFTTDTDMRCVSISGSITPSASSATPYTVIVQNMGNLAASGYTVKLFKEGAVEIASVAGTTLASGATQSYILNWTPTAPGQTYIYGKVIMPGDANTLNDETAHYPVTVQNAGTTAVPIGTGTTTLGTIPLDMFYKSSISETIYPSTAINLGGQLTGLSWFNFFTTATLQNKPTKIWVGETTQTDLTAAWIPSTALTLVFDGTVNYPAGANTITVQFTTPYVYGGGNLVVMANRPMDTAYFSSADVFYVSTGTAGCTREYHNDTTAPDPTAPPVGNVLASYPNVVLYFLAGGGTITGTVSAGGNPLPGATVHVGDGTQTTTTDASGVYSLHYIPVGTHPVIAEKHGYTQVTQNVNVTEGGSTSQNFTLALLPQVTVSGHVEANTAPGVGIVGATINLTGYEPYTATTNASGNFTITGVFASQTYNYVVTATGFQPASGQVVVATSNVNMGTLLVTEVLFPASQVVATESGANVNLNWAAPNPNAVTITEGFEGTFPSEGWTQVITNTDPANTLGVLGTWCQTETVAATPTAVVPHEGTKQVGLWWSYNHQDEWLITPQFVCPPNANLNFWTYVHQGSTNADHYYVKVSPDNGSTWTTLWDASTLPELDNAYATAYTLPLSSYSGQQIKLAWHAIDGPTMDGLWYIWFIDDINIGSPTQNISFNSGDLTTRSASVHTPKAPVVDPTLPTRISKSETYRQIPMQTPREDGRPVTGYKVYRLHVGEEATPGVWTTLTATTITALTYSDTGWSALATGDYKWAVRAEYTGGALAAPAFSNHIEKVISGTITGSVTSAAGGAPIEDATVTAGSYTANTNDQGIYTLVLPTGTYTVSCTHVGFQPGSQSNVVVNPNPAVTTVDFSLGVSNIILDEGFENYTDFSLEFVPWTLVDVDGSLTYGMTGTTWLHSGEAQSFIIFNPTATTPVIATGAEAHGGTKYAACFASTTPPNNDWIITPRIHLGATGTFSFWAKSFTAQYGLERFKVGVSTTGTLPANFTTISTGTYIEAPITWTQFTYNVDTYANQFIYIGINCVSNDAFIFMLDDITLDAPGGVANDDPIVAPILTNLGGNYPNPFNPNTYIKYSVKQATPVSITIYNVKGQKVKTLVNSVVESGDHSVLWNGTDDNNVLYQAVFISIR